MNAQAAALALCVSLLTTCAPSPPRDTPASAAPGITHAAATVRGIT